MVCSSFYYFGGICKGSVSRIAYLSKFSINKGKHFSNKHSNFITWSATSYQMRHIKCNMHILQNNCSIYAISYSPYHMLHHRHFHLYTNVTISNHYRAFHKISHPPQCKISKQSFSPSPYAAYDMFDMDHIIWLMKYCL